jgi:hypothetical protein
MGNLHCMSKEIQTLKIPFIGIGDEEALPVGKGGVWEFAHAISSGEPVRMEVAAQGSLMDVAETLATLSRALELAAALGRLATSDDLAVAVAAELHEHAGPRCDECPPVKAATWF